MNFSIGGTRTTGTDYASLGTAVTLAASAATMTKAVSVLDDNIIEPAETVIVTVGSPASATVIIEDND